MSDPPGVPSALGIEAVEWFARSDEDLTVRVTGRWRRRRPALSSQPLLVIEAGGQRRRFPAMPEPPGITGAAPGTWQLSFTVPAALAPPALERAWLQMGAVVVPLPIAVPAEGETSAEGLGGSAAAGRRPDTDEVADPQLLAERRLRSSELALQATRQRATRAEQAVADLAARVEELERELDVLRGEPARLQALLVRRDAARRAAEQRAHAEQAMRAELQDELAQLQSDGQATHAVLRELQGAHARISELEAEVEQLTRQAAEAEQIAAAARAAREQAQIALEQLVTAPPDPPSRTPDRGARIAAERRAWRGVATADAPPDHPLPLSWRSSGALSAERRLVSTRARLGPGGPADAATLAALRRELAARARREAELRGRLARATGTALAEADAQEVGASAPGPALTEALVELRAELLALRSLAENERDRRRRAELRAGELERRLGDYTARCAGAYEAIEVLRAELDRLRPAIAAAAAQAGPEAAADRPVVSAAAPAPVPGPEGGAAPPRSSSGRASLDPARLDAALARLRESAAVQDAPAAGAQPGAAGPWLARAFASLAKRDGAAAGRLLLALLDAQGLVAPKAMDYDLVLEDLGCVWVSVSEPSHRARVSLSEAPRPASEVQFALVGDLASLAGLVASGSLRRRLGRHRARITGDRRAAGALLALVHTPLSLGQLIAAGVRMDRWLCLTLAALMIDPAWTRGEQFSIGFQEPGGAAPDLYLHIRDGRRPAVSMARLEGAAATTIICAGELVLPVLAGDLRGGAQLRGDRHQMALLQRWIERAQSG